jgi:hypothetical protein
MVSAEKTYRIYEREYLFGHSLPASFALDFMVPQGQAYVCFSTEFPSL